MTYFRCATSQQHTAVVCKFCMRQLRLSSRLRRREWTGATSWAFMCGERAKSRHTHIHTELRFRCRDRIFLFLLSAEVSWSGSTALQADQSALGAGSRTAAKGQTGQRAARVQLPEAASPSSAAKRSLSRLRCVCVCVRGCLSSFNWKSLSYTNI